MGFFLETLLGGLMAGMLYSLVALGFVLIFKASGVFNFAQGSMVLLAGLALVRSLDFLAAKGFPVWSAIILGLLFAGVIMAITIIGLPWARAAISIAAYTLLPFGYKAVSRAEYSGREDIGTGPLGVVGNIIWLVLAGWWLALGHLVTAVVLAITIIGIPFAWAHLKLAGLALWPIGKMIVPAQDAPLPYARRW